MDATQIILLVFGIILVLLLVMYGTIWNGNDNCNYQYKPTPDIVDRTEFLAYVNNNVQGGGNERGCGCEFTKVDETSFGCKILNQVDPTIQTNVHLEKQVNGGSSKNASYVCLGGQWHYAKNLNAYRGLITNGGDIRFADKHIEPVMGGGDVGKILAGTHPVQLSEQEFMTAIPGGEYSDKKYFPVKTRGGKNQWFERK